MTMEPPVVRPHQKLWRLDLIATQRTILFVDHVVNSESQLQLLPSGYVKIAIEHGDLVRGFSNE